MTATVSVYALEFKVSPRGGDLCCHGINGEKVVLRGPERRSLKPEAVEWTVLHTEEVALSVLQAIKTKRETDSTKANSTSSRTHLVVVLELEVLRDGVQLEHGTVVLADLAGSEAFDAGEGVKDITNVQGNAIRKDHTAIGTLFKAIKGGKALPYHFRQTKSDLVKFLGPLFLNPSLPIKGVVIGTVYEGNGYHATKRTLEFASLCKRVNLVQPGRAIPLSAKLTQSSRRLASDLINSPGSRFTTPSKRQRGARLAKGASTHCRQSGRGGLGRHRGVDTEGAGSMPLFSLPQTPGASDHKRSEEAEDDEETDENGAPYGSDSEDDGVEVGDTLREREEVERQWAAAIKKKMEEHIEEARVQFQAEVDDLKTTLESERQAHTAEMETLRMKHETAMADYTERAQLEHQAKETSLVTALETKREAHRQRVAVLERDIATEKETHTVQMTALQARQESALQRQANEAEQQYNAREAALMIAHQAEAQALQTDLDNERVRYTEIEADRDTLTARVAELSTLLEQETAALEAESVKSNELKAQMTTLQATHATALAELETGHSTTLSDLQGKHEAVLETERQRHASEVKALEEAAASHDLEVEATVTGLRTVLAEVKDSKKRMEERVDLLEKERSTAVSRENAQVDAERGREEVRLHLLEENCAVKVKLAEANAQLMIQSAAATAATAAQERLREEAATHVTDITRLTEELSLAQAAAAVATEKAQSVLTGKEELEAKLGVVRGERDTLTEKLAGAESQREEDGASMESERGEWNKEREGLKQQLKEQAEREAERVGALEASLRAATDAKERLEGQIAALKAPQSPQKPLCGTSVVATPYVNYAMAMASPPKASSTPAMSRFAQVERAGGVEGYENEGEGGREREREGDVEEFHGDVSYKEGEAEEEEEVAMEEGEEREERVPEDTVVEESEDMWPSIEEMMGSLNTAIRESDPEGPAKYMALSSTIGGLTAKVADLQQELIETQKKLRKSRREGRESEKEIKHKDSQIARLTETVRALKVQNSHITYNVAGVGSVEENDQFLEGVLRAGEREESGSMGVKGEPVDSDDEDGGGDGEEEGETCDRERERDAKGAGEEEREREQGDVSDTTVPPAETAAKRAAGEIPMRYPVGGRAKTTRESGARAMVRNQDGAVHKHQIRQEDIDEGVPIKESVIDNTYIPDYPSDDEEVEGDDMRRVLLMSKHQQYVPKGTVSDSTGKGDSADKSGATVGADPGEGAAVSSSADGGEGVGNAGTGKAVAAGTEGDMGDGEEDHTLLAPHGTLHEGEDMAAGYESFKAEYPNPNLPKAKVAKRQLIKDWCLDSGTGELARPLTVAKVKVVFGCSGKTVRRVIQVAREAAKLIPLSDKGDGESEVPVDYSGSDAEPDVIRGPPGTMHEGEDMEAAYTALTRQADPDDVDEVREFIREWCLYHHTGERAMPLSNIIQVMHDVDSSTVEDLVLLVEAEAKNALQKSEEGEAGSEEEKRMQSRTRVSRAGSVEELPANIAISVTEALDALFKDIESASTRETKTYLKKEFIVKWLTNGEGRPLLTRPVICMMVKCSSRLVKEALDLAQSRIETTNRRRSLLGDYPDTESVMSSLCELDLMQEGCKTDDQRAALAQLMIGTLFYTLDDDSWKLPTDTICALCGLDDVSLRVARQAVLDPQVSMGLQDLTMDPEPKSKAPAAKRTPGAPVTGKTRKSRKSFKSRHKVPKLGGSATARVVVRPDTPGEAEREGGAVPTTDTAVPARETALVPRRHTVHSSRTERKAAEAARGKRAHKKKGASQGQPSVSGEGSHTERASAIKKRSRTRRHSHGSANNSM
ncbi:hypothetical protein KIPB_007114 [Kipferlia bialata]|uniref:Kinesin motor domain-containing protein n=1 Tax=Kipferlia bialata TaxID=797122 RepID=A0A9K3D0B2_9EUKA|nr:hypothetical protein KIPB_007114 [Kipferlia bialata]|eukprot:g7114.t1